MYPAMMCYRSSNLTVQDLAAVEASFDRSLLLGLGADVAAMALDAASSIQARNSLEKMLAHQLAAAHKEVMQQLGRVKYDMLQLLKRNGSMPRLDA
jgi:hypothetical protein